jgi:hypothetical protein
MPQKGFLSANTQAIIAHHHDGLTVQEIVAKTSQNQFAIYSILKRAKLEPHGKYLYDWKAVQAYYDAGNSLDGCSDHFGMNSATLFKAVRTGRLKTRTLSEALKVGYQLGRIKKRSSEAASASAKKHLLGGETNYRRYRYKGISMDSRWEVDIAEWMDKRAIEWRRDKKMFFYWHDADGVSHRYHPDFYLPA